MKPEILAPAGSREALEAAVRSGADAVYLGATLFSARRNAANFDEAGLKSAVAYCHVRGVRVHLTLNIMLRQNELPAAMEVAKSAVRAGVDAIIVQDLGLCRLLHEAFPRLELHASTQMSIHSPAALPLLKEMGITRVVAAREMSREELRKLCVQAEKSGMTVEVFIHGALCMSVSGQCLLSAVLGCRSGNRGLCAGPCRLPFLAPGGTGYDLSLKDLSLLPYLRELAQMGVASFKIEGRMKRPEYVAAATATARAALDTGFIPPSLAQALEDVFSRSGFTDGYYAGKRGKEMFGIRTKEDVTAAHPVFPMLHELYRTERQSIPLVGLAAFRAEKPSTLTVSDGAHTVTVSGAVPQPARVAALDEDSAKAALQKLGGTPYYFKQLQIYSEPGLYLRGADLNALRREAVERLSMERALPPKPEERSVRFDTVPLAPAVSPMTVLRVDRPAQIPGDLLGISLILLPIEGDLPDDLPRTVQKGVDLPRGIADEVWLKERLNIARMRGYTVAYCGNLAQIPLAKSVGFQVIGGIGLNIANPKTAEALKDAGVGKITVSPELLLREITGMPSVLPKGIFAYGKLPLMLTRNCPVANGKSCAECRRQGTLRDRKNVVFPVRCRAGFSEVFNTLPVFLADKPNDTAGLDFLLLYFTDERPERVAEIVKAYRNGVPAPGEYTRGLYYRGVQ